jgi:hypothetical protein
MPEPLICDPHRHLAGHSRLLAFGQRIDPMDYQAPQGTKPRVSGTDTPARQNALMCR